MTGRPTAVVRVDLRVGRDVDDREGEGTGDRDLAAAGAGGRVGGEGVLAVRPARVPHRRAERELAERLGAVRIELTPAAALDLLDGQ